MSHWTRILTKHEPLSLQSKSLNQDSGVLFSPPSIVKSALGVSEMMLDQDMDPLEMESAQVQPVNQYYFTPLSNSNPPHGTNHVSHSHNNPHHYHQSSSSNTMAQSIIQQQQQQLRPFHHVVASSSAQPHPQTLYHSTPVAGTYSTAQSAQVGASRGASSQSSFSRSNQGVVHVGMYDKENCPNDAPFLMLRGEDDDLDLGGFQMSKSIYTQDQPRPHQMAQQQQHCQQGLRSGVVGVSSSSSNTCTSSSGARKDGRSFGTTMGMHQTHSSGHSGSGAQTSSVGGYFGFDRTNMMQAGGGKQSPMKLPHASGYGNVPPPKVEPLDMYADSCSQASLPTNVSSPASTISYYDAQQVAATNNRPIMEFLDVNDEYWLEFAQ